MPVPQNAQAIWNFLTGQGFSSNAAAGIEGNIEQESGGDPTAGSNPPGAGLIQILGDSGGSLSSELQKTMAYIKANGSVSDINANSSSPAASALFFSTKYERPAPATANNSNRENSAEETFQAAQSGNWPAGNASSGSATDTSILSNPLASAVEPVLSWVGSQLLSKFGVSDVKDAMERLGLILLGVALLILGLDMLGHSVVSAGSSPSGAVKTEDVAPATTEKRAVAKGADGTAKTGAARAVEAAAVA
jgi:hypothetical protein